MESISVRNALRSEVLPLARLWFEGWQDAHAAIVPERLRRARTMESFEERMEQMLDGVRVVGEADDEPIGFYVLKDDELYQLYVSRSARGKGVAAALMADAERTLADQGVETAWLACAIGNERAARFYEKSGWARAGSFVSRLETQEGSIELEVWRYEKRLGRGETGS